MTIQASLKILPKASNREESYKLVDEALELIILSGLKYNIGVSETTVEGELSKVLDLIKKIHLHYSEKNIEFSFFLNSEYNIDNFYIENKEENINEVIKNIK